MECVQLAKASRYAFASGKTAVLVKTSINLNAPRVAQPTPPQTAVPTASLSPLNNPPVQPAPLGRLRKNLAFSVIVPGRSLAGPKLRLAGK